jgi:hypothetical protein
MLRSDHNQRNLDFFSPLLVVNPLISPLSDEIDGNEVKFQVGEPRTSAPLTVKKHA